jgi:hypothetical protein
MDVKAIVLVGTLHGGESAEGAIAENLAGVPIGLIDVLGRPVVDRVVERLEKFGISDATVICGLAEVPSPSRRIVDTRHRCVAPRQLGRAAERAFVAAVQAGAELIIVLRLGAYLELDWEHLINFHLDQRARVTSVCDAAGVPLDTFVASASRRNDAAYLLRHRLRQFRTPPAIYTFSGYTNLLRNANDLRCLATEGLLMKNDVKPAGREIRPGVWVAAGARLQRGARVLAPAFIGSHAKIRAAAVVTRCSTIEHHADVDCGTVVEDTSVLPHTYLGAGLDVGHAVVGFRHLFHLRRNAEVAISDPKLVGMTSPYAPLRALGSAAALASYLPTQFVRGLFAPSHREQPASLPAAVKAPSPVLNTPASINPSPETGEAEFPANLVVARRYGDQ